MAKATPQTQKAEDHIAARPDPRALATQSGGALAAPAAASFEADAGAGQEGATADSYAIPFLAVLQKGSPQVDEASGVAIEGAKSGMLFETVMQKMIDGKAGAIFVPCAYRRVFVHWGPREGSGQGFKGEKAPEDVALLRAEGKIVEQDGKLYFPLPDGSVHEKKSDRLADTRNHYGLLLDAATGTATPVLLSLTSTQIKKSKALMSMLAGVKLRHSQTGAMYTPPTYANRVKITTIPEQNDKGTWHGVKFELAGQVDTNDLYQAAKAFHATVLKGAVSQNYNEVAGTTSGDPDSDGEGRSGF